MKAATLPLLAILALPFAAAVPFKSGLSLQNNPIFDFRPSWHYVDCGDPSDLVQLQSLTVSPDPPEPGKDLTIMASGLVEQEIEEGAYADVVVKLGLVKLLAKQFDVCEEARNANVTVQCPVQPGKYDVIQSIHLPKEIPRAKFQVQVRAFTDDDEPMLCLNLFVDFMKNPF